MILIYFFFALLDLQRELISWDDNAMGKESYICPRSYVVRVLKATFGAFFLQSREIAQVVFVNSIGIKMFH